MKRYETDLLIIGGGPAGLAAAYSAYENGVRDIMIVERDNVLGGILNQCIHNGFGLTRFKEELSGPEYAHRYIDMIQGKDIKVKADSMVIDLNANHEVTISSAKDGIEIVKAKAIVLAMGCRERTRGAISIPGERVAGVYTAGAAQRYCNIDGYLVGKRAVILGSGDIGLIMARRMTLEGAKVLAVVELCPYSNGLNRNIVQCLNDFDIPLYLSHTVTDIIADEDRKRVRQVVISEVDSRNVPIKGTEIRFDCDTLLLSVGLIPENELTRKAGIEIDPKTNGPKVSDRLETSVKGVFACGNVLQVHDLVDFVSAEAEKAGKNAAKYILGTEVRSDDIIPITNGNLVNYICPQSTARTGEDSLELFFRCRKPMGKAKILVKDGEKVIKSIAKLRLAPSEMEKVILKREEIKDCSSLTVMIEEESL